MDLAALLPKIACGRVQSHNGCMISNAPARALAWPGFQPDGGLLLPLPSDTFAMPGCGSLDVHGQSFLPKQELHVTLLNRVLGNTLRNALGVETVRRHFEAQHWTIARTGEGQLLHTIKREGIQRLACGSIIERLDVPALASFRSALARAAQMEVLELLPHVTLYAAGDPAGIGLPDLAALHVAHVAYLRLPGIGNRAPPPLPQALLAAYQAADYVISVKPSITLRMGEASLRMDSILQDLDSSRAIIVTAYNPFNEPGDSRANRVRQQMLLHSLRDAGMQVLDAENLDPDCRWPAESSLLAFGTEPAFEDRLLRDFEQHALVVVTPCEPVALLLHPDHRG